MTASDYPGLRSKISHDPSGGKQNLDCSDAKPSQIVVVGLVTVYENKVAMAYLHHETHYVIRDDAKNQVGLLANPARFIVA